MPKAPNKGRFRKPYPSREGGSGAAAERDRKGYDSMEATERDRMDRAEAKKRVRNT